jgi:hypothetical protein
MAHEHGAGEFPVDLVIKICPGIKRLESETVINDCGIPAGSINHRADERTKWGDEFRRSTDSESM